MAAGTRVATGALGLWISLLGASLSAPAPEGPPPPPEPIFGVWRGTSVCMDRERAPACKDEEVLYTFTRPADGAEGKAHLKADKIVDGNVVPMGELDFAYDPDVRAWTSEFQSPRFHGLWSYSVAGGRLTGTLLELPSRAILRTVSCLRP
jgi:hypothetical protein